tara:strand:+ start:1918 stop:2262 length:345 start_codon:yes stop_codon:yes gene_type:complete
MNEVAEVAKVGITPIRNLDELGTLMEGNVILVDGQPVLVENFDFDSLIYVERVEEGGEEAIFIYNIPLENLDINSDGSLLFKHRRVYSYRFLDGGVCGDSRYEKYNQKLKEVGR